MKADYLFHHDTSPVLDTIETQFETGNVNEREITVLERTLLNLTVGSYA